MNYAQFRPLDIANGKGIRCSLFVSGCSHHCYNCFNRAYQDFNYGSEWNSSIEERLQKQIALPEIAGLTLLGGEPMQNTAGLIPILERLHAFLGKKVLQKDIWIYSGYTYEQILENEQRLNLLKLCDILVDGLYVEALRDPSLYFRGSSNQRIINIQKSLQQGEICELSQLKQ